MRILAIAVFLTVLSGCGQKQTSQFSSPGATAVSNANERDQTAAAIAAMQERQRRLAKTAEKYKIAPENK